mmetsp:Transcript_6950/g.15721  ORF Transcript_6950/g.15721 Transcript_6950/m.15721 type:complete len:397 (-) Transcript_6950:39-1229(-)
MLHQVLQQSDEDKHHADKGPRENAPIEVGGDEQPTSGDPQPLKEGAVDVAQPPLANEVSLKNPPHWVPAEVFYVVILPVRILAVGCLRVVALVVPAGPGCHPMDMHVRRRRCDIRRPRPWWRLHWRQECNDGEDVSLCHVPRPAAAWRPAIVCKHLAAAWVNEVFVADPGLADERRAAVCTASAPWPAGAVPTLGRLGEVSEEQLLQRLEVLVPEGVEQQGPEGVPRPELLRIQAQVSGRCPEPECPVEHRVVRMQLVPDESSFVDGPACVPVHRPHRCVHRKNEDRVPLIVWIHQARPNVEVLRERPQRIRLREPAQHHLVPPGHWLGIWSTDVIEFALQVQRRGDHLCMAIPGLLEEAVYPAVLGRALVVPMLLDNEVDVVALLRVPRGEALQT